MGNVPFRKPSISRSDFSLGFPPLRCRTLTTWSQVAPLVHHQSVTPGRLETSLLKKWPYKKKKKYVYHDLLGFITILVGLYFSILNKWEHIFESINQRFSDMGNTKKKTDEHAGRIRLNVREKTVQYIRQTHTHTGTSQFEISISIFLFSYLALPEIRQDNAIIHNIIRT